MAETGTGKVVVSEERVQQAEEMGGTLTRRAAATHMYYRLPNGWIDYGSVDPVEQRRLVEGGWVPLPQYGRLDILYVYTGAHPLEALFIRGGAGALSAEQIIASGYWQKPPKIPSCRTVLNPAHMRHKTECWAGAEEVTFPQVPSDTPRSFICTFCRRAFPVEMARDQHASVMHQKEQGDLRAAEMMAKALGEAMRGVGRDKINRNA